MKAKTELLLWNMLWLGSVAMRPTFRSMDESFEGWAYRNGFLAQINRLESQGFIESELDPETGKRLHRLTKAGIRAAKGDRDPEVAWATQWDQKWRLFLFDIPETQASKRRHLTRALAAAGCGCLQGSVWIAPSCPPPIQKLVHHDEPDCSHLILLEADSKGSRVDKRMVAAAWNFEAINKQYRKYLDILDALPDLPKEPNRDALLEWITAEHSQWKLAIRRDPLLPSTLLPSDYLGQRAAKRRQKLQPAIAELAKSFESSHVNPAA